MPRAAIQLAIGEEPEVERRWSRGSAIRYLQAAPGKVTRIRGVEEAKAVPGVAIVDVYPAAGEQVRPVLSSLDRIGHVIAEGETREAAVAAAEQARALVIVETEHG
jgi:biotin carboxylase